ncbi:MAG: hypothetical protein RMK35_01400, partial [Aquificaceae bacterium]|nr:hypothetical protein [Aquificaceae bacterium]
MSKQVGNYIELYPGNWLYNAGVVGWLMCFDMKGYLSGKPTYDITNDGKLIVHRRIFGRINVDNYLDSNKVVNLKGRNTYYRNFIDTGGKQKKIFEEFIKALSCANNLEKS